MQDAQNERSEYDHLFKILLIGDSAVGKSSILRRFTDNDFEEDRPCTIGVDFKTKLFLVDGKRINLTVWDTAGQEKFRSLTSSYYRGTQGIMLVYDVTRRSTFDSLTHWMKEIDMYSTNRDAIILLVGNRVDKANREVSAEEGGKFAKTHNMAFIECSAKTTLNIQQAFSDLASKILRTPSLWQKNTTPSNTVSPSQNSPEEQPASLCGGYCSI